LSKSAKLKNLIIEICGNLKKEKTPKPDIWDVSFSTKVKFQNLIFGHFRQNLSIRVSRFICLGNKFDYWYISSLIHLTIHSCNHSFMQSFIHAVVHSSTHSFIRSFIQSLIHAVVHSPVIHSFIHPIIHSFIHSFIHSSNHSFV
jgi:hypothetical protein